MAVMRRSLWALALALVGFPFATRAADGPREVLALQESFQEAIRRAEPSIGCVLVSRSDIYRRWFRQAPPADAPGRLGDFRANTPANIPVQDRDERAEYLKLLEKRFPAQQQQV